HPPGPDLDPGRDRALRARRLGPAGWEGSGDPLGEADHHRGLSQVREHPGLPQLRFHGSRLRDRALQRTPRARDAVLHAPGPQVPHAGGVRAWRPGRRRPQHLGTELRLDRERARASLAPTMEIGGNVVMSMSVAADLADRLQRRYDAFAEYLATL